MAEEGVAALGHTAGGAQPGALSLARRAEVGRAAFTPLSPVGLQVLSLPRDVARSLSLSRFSIYFRRRRWLRAVRKKGRPGSNGGAAAVSLFARECTRGGSAAGSLAQLPVLPPILRLLPQQLQLKALTLWPGLK